MKIDTSNNFATIPAGDHLLRLNAVEIRESDDKFGKSKDGKTKRLMWQFFSKATDPETGDPYEYCVWTGTAYGMSNANMTILLNQLVPDMTLEKAKTFDTDELVDKWFRARIRLEKNEAGEMKPKHILLEPYVARSAAPATEASAAPKKPTPPPPPDDEDEEKDPFAKGGN